MTKSEPIRNTQPYEQVCELVSIFQRGNIWWANWQHAGRQHRRSLKTKSKKEARLRALRLEAEVLDGSAAGQIKSATLREALEMYQQHLTTERVKAKTVNKYRTVLGRLLQIADNAGLRTMDQISVVTLDDYRHARVVAGRADKTIYNETIIIRQFVKFARSRRLMAGDPLAGVRISEPKPTLQPCWTRAEVARILEASTDRHRSILTVLADTGARVGEIKWLTWEDIDFERRLLHIRSKDDWTPKTGDSRVIPMTSRVYELLRARPREHRWVFTAAASTKYPCGDHQFSERRLLVALKRTLKRVGLIGHLHTFRHAYISHAVSMNVPEAVVREIVGHVDERILKRYTHIANQQMHAAVRNFEAPSDGPAA